MAKVEEVLGLVHGLASVVKDQQAASQDANSHTQASIQALSDAVQKLSIAVSSKESMTASPLRLPQLTSPEYTGREDLDRFAEQLTHVLSSSGVSAKYWFLYLKQQCQKDARAFDIICSFETDSTFKLPEKATNDEHLNFYDKYLCYLQKQRGIPKEQQIRQLLAMYYSMMQQANESISDFAHRFRETQHSLEKLIPGIHLSTDPKNRETELAHAFTMKLKPTIAKQLLSRDAPFPDLTSVIAAAKRYESVDSVIPTPEPDHSWKPAVLHTAKDEPSRTNRSHLKISLSQDRTMPQVQKFVGFITNFTLLNASCLTINAPKVSFISVPSALGKIASFVLICNKALEPQILI